MLGVVSGAATLGAMAFKVTTLLVDLKDSFRNAGLLVLDLVAAIKAVTIAWTRIKDWAEGQLGDTQGSILVFEELSSYLEFSKSVLDTIQHDIERLNARSKLVWRARGRTTTVLHEKMLRAHCESLHRQTSSLHLLLSTAKLWVPMIEAYQAGFLT